MSTALIVLAALLTALQFWDGWTTYQIIKYGGIERNPVVKWFIDRLGVYVTMLIGKTVAIACTWVIARFPLYVEPMILIADSWFLVVDDLCTTALVVLMALYIWIAVGNWQVLQTLKGKK